MKLCFVLGDFPELSQTFVINQILGMLARGHQVSVVSDRLTRAPADPTLQEVVDEARFRWRWPKFTGAMARRAPGKVAGALVAAADLSSGVDLDGYGVLIAHFGENGRRLARLKRWGRLRRPFVTVFHGYDVALPAHQGRLGRYGELFASGELLLPVSDYFRRLLIEAGASPDRVRVHRMGVDCASLRFEPRRRDGGDLRMISVGRLVEKKGAEYAIRALGELRRRRPDIDWGFDFVGDGPLLGPLSALSTSLGLADRIAFLGPRPHEEVMQLLRAAHLFVLPSVTAPNGDMEGVPVALMEAMACGLPVVSSVHSGIPELIEHEVSGLLAPERDVAALSALIEWAADNPAGCEALALAARDKVERDFDQRKLDDAMASLLSQIVEGDRAT